MGFESTEYRSCWLDWVDDGMKKRIWQLSSIIKYYLREGLSPPGMFYDKYYLPGVQPNLAWIPATRNPSLCKIHIVETYHVIMTSINLPTLSVDNYPNDLISKTLLNFEVEHDLHRSHSNVQRISVQSSRHAYTNQIQPKRTLSSQATPGLPAVAASPRQRVPTAPLVPATASLPQFLRHATCCSGSVSLSSLAKGLIERMRCLEFQLYLNNGFHSKYLYNFAYRSIPHPQQMLKLSLLVPRNQI